METELHPVNGHVAREMDIEVSTDFDKRHAKLEIQTPNGWQTLSTTPLRTRLTGGDSLRWPLRLTLEHCPEACRPTESHHVTLLAHRSDGVDQRLDIPIQVEIVPDPWYICWRSRAPARAGGDGRKASSRTGLFLPYRFGRRAGVQLSQVEDLAEGYFYSFRSIRGSSSGFYRDAMLHLTDDFRIVSRKRGAFACLRAYRTNIRLRPENGNSIWRQQADGSWEQLNPLQETLARPGVLYRNDRKSLYFDIRSK